MSAIMIPLFVEVICECYHFAPSRSSKEQQSRAVTDDTSGHVFLHPRQPVDDDRYQYVHRDRI